MMDISNTIVNTLLLVTCYGDRTNTPNIDIGPQHSPDILTHIHCYTNDIIVDVQGGIERKYQVFDDNFQALKWILIFLPNNDKESLIFMKIMAGEGDYTCANEVLWWNV